MFPFPVDKTLNAMLPEAVKLVPGLASLSQSELRYVIAVADNMYGPYRLLPEEDRKEMARKNYWKGKSSPFNDQKIIAAINDYQSLIFDPRRERKEVYVRKIRQLEKQIMHDDIKFKDIEGINKAIDFLQKSIDKLNKELSMDEENIIIK